MVGAISVPFAASGSMPRSDSSVSCSCCSTATTPMKCRANISVSLASGARLAIAASVCPYCSRYSESWMT